MIKFKSEMHSFIPTMEAMGYFVEIFDDQNRYIYASPSCSRYTNENEFTIIGKRVDEVFCSDHKEGFYFSRGKGNAPINLRNIPMVLRKDGQKMYALVDESNIVLDDGSVGMICLSKFFNNKSEIMELISKLEHGFIKEVRSVSRSVDTSFDDIVTCNEKMKTVISHASQIASSDSSVLILGETGTGKELIAQSIHSNSARKEKPFVAINCSAIPDGLFESTFFGSEKGAYTDAVSRKGLFEEANHGTLFLDELNSLNKVSQAKLLRILETKTVRRLGGNQDIHLDCRIISAMNCDPMKAVEKDELRSDLFYRLSGSIVQLPKLNERKDDIVPLANYFLSRYCSKTGKSLSSISSDVVRLLMEYGWPGNVRELKNVIEHSTNVAMNSDVILEIKHLPDYFTHHFHMKSGELGHSEFDDLLQVDFKEAKKVLLYEFERKYLISSLKKHRGNISAAAKELNISRQNFYQAIKRLNINLSDIDM